MTKLKRLVAVALAILMILGSLSMSAFADNTADGSTLSITTKIFRLVNGEWIETEKVKAGEQVMARVYVGTDYYTNSGSLLFFYNNDFFTDSYGSEKGELDVNPVYAGGSYGITGEFWGSKSASTIKTYLTNAGRIDSDFASKNNFFYLNYYFGSRYRNQKLDGSKWLCQFALTVKSEPESTQGIFRAIESTTATPEFIRGKIDVPRGTYDGYNEDTDGMYNWDATLNYVNQPVTLYANSVSATFKTSGGAFSDKSTTAYFEGDSGDALTIADPIRDGFKFLGWKVSGEDDSTASSVTAYPAADTVYEAVWQSTTGSSETLTFRTEIYRYDAEKGEWIFTEKVKPGEDVKARVFIDTSYYAQAGDLMFFYDSDFFEDSVSQGVSLDLNVNPSEVAENGSTGFYAKIPSTSYVVKNLLDSGYISQSLVDSHTIYTARYQFDPTTGHKISGDEWFAEFDLKVRDDATGEGDFFISEDTLASPTRVRGYVNIPLSSEGGEEIDSEGMYLWEVNASITSNPVSVDSSITLKANGGAFAAEDEETFVIEGVIGSAVDESLIPELTKSGSVLLGWVDASIENPTEDDIIDLPAEMPYDEIVLKAYWLSEVDVKYVLNNGEEDLIQTVVPGEALVAPENPEKEGNKFIGWSTDAFGSTITGLPETNPDEDTSYYAIFNPLTYEIEYYVVNPNSGKFENVGEGSVIYGEPVISAPPSYEIPEGYELSKAYTDPTLTQLLAEDATMPAQTLKLYYDLTAKTFDATFIVDEEEYAKVPTVYDSEIKAPDDPQKEGYVFTGWEPEVGFMDEEGKTFVATWKKAEYTVTYNSDGEVYEEYDVLYEDEVPVPADPEKEGYTFTGWTPAVPETMPAESLVFEAVYQVNSYDVNFDADGGVFDDGSSDKTVETAYGEKINAPADPEKEGYVFAGWDPALPETMPDEEVSVKAKWEPAKDTPYTVEYYTMGTDGQYGEPVIENRTGTTGETARVTPPVTDGHYIAVESVFEAVIAADGSTVLKVYYARKSYYITFNANGGTFEDGSTEPSKSLYLYGSKVTAPADPEKEGYTFIGWLPTVSGVVTEEAEYVAQWRVDSHTISFENTGDSVIEDIKQDYGTAVAAPEDPVKKGYEFKGWDPALPETMPAEDMTVSAKWEAKSFESLFYENADDGLPYDTTSSVYGEDIVEPADEPSKVGYTFKGWSTDGENVLEDLGIMDEEGKIFYAVWEAADVEYKVEHYFMTTELEYPETASRVDSFTATADLTVTAQPDSVDNFTVDETKSVLEAVAAADGSTVLKVYYKRAVYTLKVDVDGTVTETEYPFEANVIPEPDPEKEGYTFSGWVDENDEDTQFPDKMPGDDVTIKASWTVNKHNVTYYSDKNIVYYGPVETDFGSPIEEPSVPTKVGYVFAGWFDEDGNKPGYYGTMPDKDLEFTAKWTANANIGYVLEIYEMGTDGEYPETPTSSLNFNDGVVGDIRTVTPTVKTGFELDKTNSVLSGEIPATETLVLKAYYVRNSHTLTYVVDEDSTDETYYYGEEIAEAAAPEKTGYVFAGWVDEHGVSVVIPAVMPDNDITVYASWEEDSYNAVFDAGEGTFKDGPVAEIPVKYGDDITAPETDPTRDGYEFVGWAKADKPDEVIDDFGKMGTEDQNFVAVWNKVTYTVTFYDFDAPAGGPNLPTVQKKLASTTKNYKETVTFPDDPSFEHHTFLGWSTVKGNPDYIVEEGFSMPSKDVELFAVYERVKVMLIPKNDTCTTYIDRSGLTVDDYVDGESKWYVYGLELYLTESVLLDKFIDVSGDGRIEIEYESYHRAPSTGTGTIINVYDNVTNELVESFRIIIFGDLNGDARINSVDASMASDESLGTSSWSYELDEDGYIEYRTLAADVSLDNRVSGIDTAMISDASLGNLQIDQRLLVGKR